jgi:hypothetical protein
MIRKNLKIFLIYSPENTALRNFYKEGQIEPLGINGEGLLKLLKVIDSSDKKKFNIIEEHLKLFSWFEKLSIPENLSESEDSIRVKDRYVKSMLLLIPIFDSSPHHRHKHSIRI